MIGNKFSVYCKCFCDLCVTRMVNERHSWFKWKVQIITARVCSTREGNIYTWKCLSVHFWGGVPDPALDGGVPGLRSRGGTQSQVLGVTSLRSGEVPHLRLGGTQSQVGGVLSLRSGGYSVSGLGGYPVSGLGGYPGYPPSKGKKFWHQIWLDTCSD